MAVRQRKAPVSQVAPLSPEQTESEEEQPEQDYHTEPSDDEADEEQLEEYHTGPEDESDKDSENAENDIPLLPAELLKSKPTAQSTVGTTIEWEKMTQKEKKALRDDLGVSMRELRDEAQRNGVIKAGRLAQMRRGIRPAEKVAGSRVIKRKRKTKRSDKPLVSGRQKLIESRSRDRNTSTGSNQRASKKRKG